MSADPLIVTLTLDPADQERFDALRAAHFPPERLVVGAHVTLFHALPGEAGAAVADALRAETANERPFGVAVSSVRFLGRGVAFGLRSETLSELRGRLRRRFDGMLTAQDRQGWQPHVTVQNKVDAPTARALHRRLSGAFVPHDVTATGLALWHYRGGPWQAAGAFAFAADG